MTPPPRCFECGGVVGDKYELFTILLQKGYTPVEAYEDLGIPQEDHCCRRMLFSSLNMTDPLIVRNTLDSKSGKKVIELTSLHGRGDEGTEDTSAHNDD